MKLVRTKITLSSIYPTNHAKSVQLFDTAKALGFEMSYPNQAVLYNGEAEDVKNSLRAYGMADSDFQLHLEYQRAWGFL